MIEKQSRTKDTALFVNCGNCGFEKEYKSTPRICVKCKNKLVRGYIVYV